MVCKEGKFDVVLAIVNCKITTVKMQVQSLRYLRRNTDDTFVLQLKKAC